MKKRRKAIDCKLVGESKSSPGYFKYEIIIEERDGRRHKQPAYGRDMEDAISRLVWTEKANKVGQNNVLVATIVLGWLTTVIVPCVVASIQRDPLWVFMALGLSVIFALALAKINRYLQKNHD